VPMSDTPQDKPRKEVEALPSPDEAEDVELEEVEGEGGSPAPDPSTSVHAAVKNIKHDMVRAPEVEL
jgi:hypothetical protein